MVYREDALILEVQVGVHEQKLERGLVPPIRHLFQG